MHSTRHGSELPTAHGQLSIWHPLRELAEAQCALLPSLPHHSAPGEQLSKTCLQTSQTLWSLSAFLRIFLSATCRRGPVSTADSAAEFIVQRWCSPALVIRGETACLHVSLTTSRNRGKLSPVNLRPETRRVHRN